MSSTSNRIQELLTKSDQLVQANELQKAAEALREASHLDANDQRIKDAWLGLQKRDQGGGSPVQLLNDYVISKKDDDGEKALQTLRQKSFSQDEVKEIFSILQKADDDLSLLDRLTGTVLSSSSQAKQHVAAQMLDRATDTFEEFSSRGKESFTAFVALILDASVWQDKQAHITAQKDLFRLCVASVIEAGEEHPEYSMRAIARQLAAAPEPIRDILDQDVFDVVLSSLDIRLEQSLRSQAMLATTKLLEISRDKGESIFSNFVAGRVAKQTNDDMIIAFSAASAAFPVIPAVGSRLFMTDGFVQQLVPNLEKNSEAAASGKRKSQRLEQAALELLSAACIDKASREAIKRYCESWLQDLIQEREGHHKALAALVLAKIRDPSERSDISKQLSDLVLSGNDEETQAVEGLAYTSLEPKVKEELVANKTLMERLIKTLREEPSMAFGCLTVFANLTAYRPALSAEQKKMSDLKAYANSQKPTAQDPLDNNGVVTARCKKVLDFDIVPALVHSCKQGTSPSTIALVVRVLLSLSMEQKHRAKMAQQNAIKLLLQIRDRVSKTDKSTPEAAQIERTAAHALARLLISLNPSHIFSPTLPATSAVSALIPLLSDTPPTTTSTLSADTPTDLLPTFEALLALTNLASLPNDPSPRDLQLRLAWPRIQDLLLSPNTMLQRASMELVCNLMASPACIAHFADGSAPASNRMHVLLALADVRDAATRRAAGGALAMLTEWDAAVTAVLDKERGVGILLGLVEEGDPRLRHRGLVCVANLCFAPGAVGERARAAVVAARGVEVVKAAVVASSGEEEVLAVGVEVLKKLVGDGGEGGRG
ncbi:hypothetical protein MBLNU230_g2308t1 [Neophaeotheca triangularis]